MFGFAAADPAALSEAQRARYRGVYCGVCRAMGENRAFYHRAALSYDFVLPALVLSTVSGCGFQESRVRCGVHPLRLHTALSNRFTRYAADMNVLLAYYKFEDDRIDEGGSRNAIKTAMFRRAASELSVRYPAQSEAIRTCLSALSAMEAENELRPDRPAAAFGALLGTVFAEGADVLKPELFAFGMVLGRAVYLMDAAVDLQDDLRKKRYNPLVRTGFSDCEAMLEQELAACLAAFRALDAQADREIVENVLLSGIWMQYEAGKQRSDRQRERKSVPRSGAGARRER